jgi:hypothetical protein
MTSLHLIHTDTTPLPAAHRGRRFDAILPMNQVLAVGDYVVAENGLFFATLRDDGVFVVVRGIDSNDPDGLLWDSGKVGAVGPYYAVVHDDGNFCIYQGSDQAHHCGDHWSSQMTAKGSQFYAAMQDDGNFSIRKGKGPQDSCGLIWATGATDRVESIVEVLHIEYDLAEACVLRTSPANLYSETIHNHGNAISSHSLAGAVAITETTAWSNAVSARYCADTHFRAPVPVLDGDECILSDHGARFEPNGAQTTIRHWGFDTPVNVAPQGAVRASIAVTYSTIAVPYVLLGQLRFESGMRVLGPIRGAYLGTNAHSLTATFMPRDAASQQGRIIQRALRPQPASAAATMAAAAGN